MERKNKILDDLTRLAGSTFSGIVNVKSELSSFIQNKIETFIKSMDFVTREEFEVVKKLAQDNSLMIKKMQKEQNNTSKNQKSLTKKRRGDKDLQKQILS